MAALPSFPDLKGQSVFITGGGSGIGAALTEGFLRQGAKVAFCQRSDGSAFCDVIEQATGNRKQRKQGHGPADLVPVEDRIQKAIETS